MGILDKIRGLSWVVGSRKGEKAVKDGRWEDALVHLDEALALNPKDAYAYFYRGLAHGGLGDLNAAIRDLNTAREVRPARQRSPHQPRHLLPQERAVFCRAQGIQEGLENKSEGRPRPA